MKIHILTANLDKHLDISIQNILHFKDYIQNNEPEIYKAIEFKNLHYILEKENSIVLIDKFSLLSDITGYESLIVMERLEGKYQAAAGYIATMVSSISIQATGTLLLSKAATLAIGYTAAYLIGVGISMGLGELIQMISPSNTMDGDGSKVQKNYIFNGIPNIKEQGGSVPIVLGECLFGGVAISVNIKTNDITIGSEITLDNTIPLIDISAMPTVTESTWYRIT